MPDQQTHQHDAHEREVAVDICPLCGSKISRAEFLEVQEKIRIEVQSQALQEIERITAQKDREREAAVSARDAAVRKQLADQAARDTAEALRKQRELQQALELAKAEKVSSQAALLASKEALAQQKKEAQTARTAEMLQVRESLEKGHKLAVLEKEQEHTRERERWQKKVAELERQVQHKTSNDLGDATQIQVLDSLRNAYPDDRVTPIAKGKQGADIRHEVLQKGNACGKILIDAKNHEGWRYGFVTKLKEDQRAEHAEYAILSTTEFPSGKKVLCVEET